MILLAEIEPKSESGFQMPVAASHVSCEKKEFCGKAVIIGKLGASISQQSVLCTTH
jgi:hypothetical protein